MDDATIPTPAQTEARSIATAGRDVCERADPRDRLIVALDFPSAEKALGLVERLEGCCRWFKVGMELYYAAGNRVIEGLRERGYEVFLDLKLHDIPNTVAGAVRSVTGVGASLLTVHAGGGEPMMRAAAEAATAPGAPRLLAVTVLTSMDEADLRAVGVEDHAATQVLRLARLAQTAGIGGLVCSAEEVETVRAAMGQQARLVVPGIRPAGAGGGDDQRRVASAAQAIARGATMLVVGRPITQAADPARAATGILAEIASVL
ncbi:MAG TPA: orotidine-5'-phosphate decarboxylase [Acidobacteriaceae bacterium]|jgi:orotidine-5'-phosphate decarboxylase|nr:orotidine-5'-phosphate decarboxylase [Acidobacteriaceae bacterium]